jgi:hypothetical protein
MKEQPDDNVPVEERTDDKEDESDNWKRASVSFILINR